MSALTTAIRGGVLGLAAATACGIAFTLWLAVQHGLVAVSVAPESAVHWAVHATFAALWFALALPRTLIVLLLLREALWGLHRGNLRTQIAGTFLVVVGLALAVEAVYYATLNESHALWIVALLAPAHVFGAWLAYRGRRLPDPPLAPNESGIPNPSSHASASELG